MTAVEVGPDIPYEVLLKPDCMQNKTTKIRRRKYDLYCIILYYIVLHCIYIYRVLIKVNNWLIINSCLITLLQGKYYEKLIKQVKN